MIFEGIRNLSVIFLDNFPILALSKDDAIEKESPQEIKVQIAVDSHI